MTPALTLITESYGLLPDCRHSLATWNCGTNQCGSNWQSQEFWYMF